MKTPEQITPEVKVDVPSAPINAPSPPQKKYYTNSTGWTMTKEQIYRKVGAKTNSEKYKAWKDFHAGRYPFIRNRDPNLNKRLGHR